MKQGFKAELNALIKLSLVSSLLFGCQSLKTAHNGAASTDKSGPDAAPMAPRQVPMKLAVILGPGGAKSFAHIGVLRELQKQRIPIHGLQGMEWGALVAALYAEKSQINDVEWKLYKMEQRKLPFSSALFGSNLGQDSVTNMDPFLEEAFGSFELSASKIPFACPTRSFLTGLVVWQNKGLAKDVVKKCLPYPPIFKPKGNFFAGASQLREGIEKLKAEGFTTVLVVDVLGSARPLDETRTRDFSSEVLLWQEVRRAWREGNLSNPSDVTSGVSSGISVEWVHVDTSPYPMTSFAAKAELVGLGEAAVQRVAPQLINKYKF